MQKLEGDGLIFIHAGGTIREVELKAGESLQVDTGCLVAMTSTVTFDIQKAGGIKSMLFGGEGLFFANLTGPGPHLDAIVAVLPNGRSNACRSAANGRRWSRRRFDPWRPRQSAPTVTIARPQLVVSGSLSSRRGRLFLLRDELGQHS